MDGQRPAAPWRLTDAASPVPTNAGNQARQDLPASPSPGGVQRLILLHGVCLCFSLISCPCLRATPSCHVPHRTSHFLGRQLKVTAVSPPTGLPSTLSFILKREMKTDPFLYVQQLGLLKIRGKITQNPHTLPQTNVSPARSRPGLLVSCGLLGKQAEWDDSDVSSPEWHTARCAGF